MQESRLLSYENGLLLLLGVSFGIVFFDRNALNYLMPYILDDLALSNTQIGLLGSGLALSWALSAYFISAWSDHCNRRKPFLLASIVIFSCCSILSGFAQSFLMLLAARVVMGLAEGPFLPVCLAIMNQVSSPKRRGLNAGIMQNVFSALLGTSVASVILVLMAERFGWRNSFYLAGVPGLICALLIWRYVREPEAPRAAAPGPVQNAGFFTGLRTLLRVRNARICALISCCMVGWLLLGAIFLPVFFTEYRHISPLHMSRIMAALGICSALGGSLVPALSDRIGRKPVMIVFCLVSMLAPLTAVFFQGPLWLLGAIMFIGWCGTGVFPLFMGVVPGESVSPGLAATAMGMVVCTGEIAGGFVLPAVAGWVADQTNLTAPILIAAGCALCGGLLGFLLEETVPARVKVAPAGVEILN